MLKHFLIGLKILKNENIKVADIKNSNLKKAKTFKNIKTINPLKGNIKKENYNHIFITTGEKKAIKFAIDSSNPPSNIYFVGVGSKVWPFVVVHKGVYNPIYIFIFFNSRSFKIHNIWIVHCVNYRRYRVYPV